MRYILDSSGYVESVSCTPFNCKNQSCKEYTGTIPSGYDTLEEWALNANIRAYKITNNNLVYDAAKDEALQAEWANKEAGYICEKGNNNNGAYIKYSDGTMLCYGAVSGTSNLSDYWGQFKRTDENLTLTFPVAFSEAPTSVQLTGDSYSSIVCTLIKNITETQLTFFCLKPNSVSSKDYGVKWLAIGKWK